jgi:putative flippase GtrA
MKIKNLHHIRDWILIKKIFRYTIGWGLAALLDLFFLWFFTDILHIYYIYSAILSFIIIFYFGFAFQKYITFENKEKKIIKQWVYFLIFQLIWIWINILLLWVGVSVFKFYYLYVAVFNKWLIFLWNFFMNYIFTFRLTVSEWKK